MPRHHICIRCPLRDRAAEWQGRERKTNGNMVKSLYRTQACEANEDVDATSANSRRVGMNSVKGPLVRRDDDAAWTWLPMDSLELEGE
jgi:hypothetical protein